MIIVSTYIFLIIVYGFVTVFILYTLYAMVTAAPYVPTNKKQVKTMIEMAQVAPTDTVLDLGSGDGRIVLEAAPFAQKVIGIEINPLLYYWSIWKARKKNNITFLRKDLWTMDLTGVDVLTLFFMGPKMEKLKKKIQKEMKPGSRVVSYAFTFPCWEPKETKDNIRVYIV
ncbi:MAG: SAM-dependent methyltransferase [Candidatus Magasanikbacteria bacterium]|nr:SAM-dependent methyltransferase [Candidatus Magasanikbacteria bacterium]